MDAEALEADTRQLMAEHAAIEVRGFDGLRDRMALHHKIDQRLDELAIVREMAGVDSELESL